VLVEGTSRTDRSQLRGRTRQNKTVIFDAADGAAPEGTLQPVRIDAATSMTLRGTHAVRAAA
jgi:tRNA A37 methylthiotransferase MiaB